MKGYLKSILSFLQTFVLALAIVIPIRFFLFQPFIVNGASMEPTFKNGEYLLIDEISYKLKGPKRGDVIVFKYPKDPSYFYIKRIIGLPGETVEIEDQKVKIYNYDFPTGRVLNESYIKGLTMSPLKIVLDKNQYFVLGDNREHSSDSRAFGAVPKKNIVGKAWIAIYPTKGIEIIRGNNYQYAR
jgi:signal peptidase I